MTRQQLIEEIVEEYQKLTERCFYPEAASFDPRTLEPWLRSSFLRISDASMDAVEVEEDNSKYETELFQFNREGWNAAHTASQEKRQLFTNNK